MAMGGAGGQWDTGRATRPLTCRWTAPWHSCRLEFRWRSCTISSVTHFPNSLHNASFFLAKSSILWPAPVSSQSQDVHVHTHGGWDNGACPGITDRATTDFLIVSQGTSHHGASESHWNHVVSVRRRGVRCFGGILNARPKNSMSPLMRFEISKEIKYHCFKKLELSQ